jgi:hypothetical protein
MPRKQPTPEHERPGCLPTPGTAATARPLLALPISSTGGSRSGVIGSGELEGMS